MGSFAGMKISRKLAVKQATMLVGFLFIPFVFFDDGWCTAEVGVGGRYKAPSGVGKSPKTLLSIFSLPN